MTQAKKQFTAVVLAGDRGPQDPLVLAAGVSSKALVPVAGRSMILRVLDALAASPSIGARLVCGSSPRLLHQEPELAQLVSGGAVRWLENEPSPSLSARTCLETIPADQPVLLTTADHALLTPQMVEDFCARAVGTGCDVVAALAPAELVMKAFPEGRRTITRLRGGSYCGCNLFAFLTPRGRRAALFWRRIEEQRKHPLKIVRTLGVTSVVRYLLGRLTLEQGLARLSTAMDARAGAVWMTEAEAAVDVDKVADWRLVEKILAARQRSTSSP
ncbi:MAG: nucleotidyltransferase family protein [Geoalkalibacter sp.]|uniref:nucleotidyltransferase family protein n=1 Tax=Geoalkalibacter sp. TaxID=3041440 RepID=UPI003D13B9C0